MRAILGSALLGMGMWTLPVAAIAQLSVPVDTSGLQAQIVAAQTTANSAPQFVAGGAFMPTASLLTSYPCASNVLGKLAHVSDLYGSVASTLVCEQDQTLGYYWRPQRTDYSSVLTQTSGTVTLTPLATAPVIFLSATPTASVNIALSTTNVWPGATFHLYAPATITVNGITITGLVGGGTVPLLQGSDKIVTYTASGWKSN